MWPCAYFPPLLSISCTSGPFSLLQVTPKQNQKSKKNIQHSLKWKSKTCSSEAWGRGEKRWWPLKTGVEEGLASRGMETTSNGRKKALPSARARKGHEPPQGDSPCQVLQGKMSWIIWQLKKQPGPHLRRGRVGHMWRLGDMKPPVALTTSAPLPCWNLKKLESS